jgi:hypothetical protein
MLGTIAVSGGRLLAGKSMVFAWIQASLDGIWMHIGMEDTFRRRRPEVGGNRSKGRGAALGHRSLWLTDG